MAKPRAKQTDNKVSMEEATTLGGRRKALAARRSKTELAALREDLKPRPRPRAPRARQDRRRARRRRPPRARTRFPRPPCG